MRRIRRGDVFWTSFDGGRRPAVVVTRDTVIPLLSTVVVVPATATVRGIPAQVHLRVSDGMPQESALSLDNIQVVPKGWLGRRITSLSQARLDELCEALRYAMGC